MSLFLTSGPHSEVAELTDAHTRARQIANLVRNGVPHTVSAAGWPKVARAWLDRTPGRAQDDRPAWRPNALRRAANG